MRKLMFCKPSARYTYEQHRDLLTGVRNHLGETDFSVYAYTNDTLGRRTSKNDEQYGYNARGELTSAMGNGNYSYQYDDIGNRRTSAECGENSVYTANGLNQYTQLNRAIEQSEQSNNFLPAYDLDGNQTLVKTATGVWQVTYNGENRPVRWVRGSTVVTMDFDSMGRRTFYCETENDVLVSSSRFFYDGYLMIQQLDHDSPHAVQKEFIWDPTEPVATKPLVFRQNGMDSAYLTHDGNKNVADVIRAAPYNDRVGHYEYAPFGAVKSAVGSRAADNPFRFSSEYADDTLGLDYYNYRHYEPLTGRWSSRDPIGERGGVNLYVNCGNEFTSCIDCLGEDWKFSAVKGEVIVSYELSDEQKKCCQHVLVKRYVKSFFFIGGTIGNYVPDSALPPGEANLVSMEKYIGYAEGDAPQGQGFLLWRLPWTQSFKWEAICQDGAFKGKVLSTVERDYYTEGHWIFGYDHGFYIKDAEAGNGRFLPEKQEPRQPEPQFPILPVLLLL